MSVEDALLTRDILRDISKHPVDISLLTIGVSHGVIYLSGKLQKIRGHDDMDLSEELHVIMRVIRQKPGIRDVINEVDLRESSLFAIKKKAHKY